MRVTSMLMFIALVAPGCKGDDAPAPPSGMPPASAAPALPPSAIPHAVAAAEPQSPAPGPVTGTVAERIDAASYTYLRVTTSAGDVWTAVPATPTPVGTKVTVMSQMALQNFESRTLNRKFASIIFGTLAGAAPAPGQGPSPGSMPPSAEGLPPGHPAAPPPPSAADVKVPKATGPDAKTVSEVWSGKKALVSKSVVVRGKVVKYNTAVMGKNWLHVRDGSGSETANDNDLTITTQDTANVGDVVTVKGTVHLDRDFGAGYKYEVILEDAALQK